MGTGYDIFEGCNSVEERFLPQQAEAAAESCAGTVGGLTTIKKMPVTWGKARATENRHSALRKCRNAVSAGVLSPISSAVGRNGAVGDKESARAGARNNPLRRGRGALRRCAATPHPPPSGASVSLRVGRFADLTRHRRVIQRREPLKGEGFWGAAFSTANPSRGKALGDGGRSEKCLPWLGQAAAPASAPMNAGTVLLSDNGDKRLCPREYAGNRN